MGNCIRTVMSHVMHSSEKFSMFPGCSIITCVIMCMTCMIGFRIGLGYNYSFVDYKTKHVYVAGQYKKTCSTDYYGFGYFKLTTRPVRRKPKLLQPSSGEPEIFEKINEVPLDTPSKNSREYLRAKDTEFPVQEKDRQGDSLHSLYLTTLKTLSTTKFALLENFNDSLSANTPVLSVKNKTETKVDIADKSSEQRNHLINTAEEYSGSEAIRVDVTKIMNADNSSISKSIMNLKQLLTFLTMLREKKKNFSVQVTF